MKKTLKSSTFAIGVVALIMAFLVTLQIKSVLYNFANNPGGSMRTSELLAELETLRKKNAQLTELNNALQFDIQSFKNEASTNSDYSKTLVNQLKRAEIMAGLIEVEGEGIIVTVKDSTYTEIEGDAKVVSSEDEE